MFKILFLDIEATDLAADIGHVLSIGYKWAHENKPHVLSIMDYPGNKVNDDSKLLKAFEPIWAQADLVVHHFGEFYDEPFLRTRRLIHGMKPMPDVARVDTWRICKKRLRLGSNRLERVLSILKCPIKKTPVDIMIWADARVGDRKAMKYVVKHNHSDVLIEEFVYNRLAPIWNQHPRTVISKDDMVCGVCGGKNEGHGYRATLKGRYRRLLCTKCGHTSTGPKV